MNNVGIVGLGAMGRPMAENLARSGQLSWVWNRSGEKARAFVDEFSDVKMAQSLSDLAQACDMVLVCVSADKDVTDVVEAMLSALQPGSIVVDTSTISAAVSQDLYRRCQAVQVSFLDVPVSGGVEGAVKGTLAMMVGGDQTALDQVRSVLETLSVKIVYMGESGSGQATKAVNQIMAAGINQAVTEALAFGQAMGLDMDKLIDIVSSGAAGNWFLQHRGPSMTQDIYEPGFKVGLHHKDLILCKAMIDALSDSDKSLPIVEMTLIHYQRLMDQGYADEDISALYRLKKDLF